MENQTEQEEIDDTKKEDETSKVPQGVPDKFIDPKTGEVNIDALVKSYLALEKKLSEKPAEEASSHAPHSPDDYCIDCENSILEVDPEVNKRLHAKGFSQEQAQEVYDLANEKMMPMINQLSGDFMADREVEKLVEHFGGAEQWQEVSRQLLAFGQKSLPADVLTGLSGSYEGVIALYNMMQNGEPSIAKKASRSNAMDEKDLQSMMKDPKYWRDKDPAFVAKVTQGFESMYGK